MKHLFITVTLFLSSLCTFSQFRKMDEAKLDSITNVIIASDTLTPRKGEKTLTFALADNSGFFMFKRYCSPKLAVRYGFSGYYSVSNLSNPQPTGPATETKNRNSAFQVFLGFQRSIGNFKKFEPYMGMDFGIGNRMESYTSTYYNSNNGFAPNAPMTVIETKNERKVYFSPSASFTPLIGFNYYIAERFALGAEYRIPVVNFYMTNNSKLTVTEKYANGTSNTQELKDADVINVNGSLRGIAYVTATMFLFCK